MSLTLPQPKLSALDLNWVVLSGKARNVNAFATADDAARFAAERAAAGARVAAGHTIHGWCDFLDTDAPAAAMADAMRKWAQEFNT